MKHTKWTDELDEALRVYWENGYADWEIADAMGIESSMPITYRRQQLGLRKPRGTPWSAMDDIKLIDHLHLSNAELADVMDRTIWSVAQRKKELGLRKRKLEAEQI